MLRRLLLPCVMATMLPAPLAAADWQAGLAAVKITPEGPWRWPVTRRGTSRPRDVFGYLPSTRVPAEGGYETRGVSHGGPGFFSPQAQEVVVSKVKELAARAGRALPADKS